MKVASLGAAPLHPRRTPCREAGRTSTPSGQRDPNISGVGQAGAPGRHRRHRSRREARGARLLVRRARRLFGFVFTSFHFRLVQSNKTAYIDRMPTSPSFSYDRRTRSSLFATGVPSAAFFLPLHNSQEDLYQPMQCRLEWMVPFSFFSPMALCACEPPAWEYRDF